MCYGLITPTSEQITLSRGMRSTIKMNVLQNPSTFEIYAFGAIRKSHLPTWGYYACKTGRIRVWYSALIKKSHLPTWGYYACKTGRIRVWYSALIRKSHLPTWEHLFYALDLCIWYFNRQIQPVSPFFP